MEPAVNLSQANPISGGLDNWLGALKSAEDEKSIKDEQLKQAEIARGEWSRKMLDSHPKTLEGYSLELKSKSKSQWFAGASDNFRYYIHDLVSQV